MIVKHKERDFRNETVWGYIGNVSQVAVKEIDADVYIKMYDDLPTGIAKYPTIYDEEGNKLPKEIADINKIFSMVTKYIIEDSNKNIHCENLIFDYAEESVMPIYAVLMYIEDSKEFDAICLITDQTTYLLNEKGQTVERLV